MKKISLFLFSLLILFGCDSIPEGVIEPASVNFRVEKITAPSSFQITELDSSFNISIQLSQSEDIIGVYFNIIETSTSEDIYSANSMIDSGDNTFSSEITMSRLYAVGNYSVEFFVKKDDDLQTTSKVAVHQFYFDNGQNNIAPVLSELVAPDTVIVQDPKSVILLSIQVSDENGARDVESVYFTTTRPNGTSNNQQIDMFDNGNLEQHGDSVAGDGRYSRLIEVTPANMKGAWKFNFQAKDKGKKLSTVISHTIQIL
ncbi:MAG: hypothetical protein V1720_06365 [bacterium]